MARTLIGRESQLDALERVVDDAARGITAAAVISGDAGVGKTRLLTELRRRAEARGFDVMVGHCLDLGEVGIPYLAFTEIFGRLDHSSRAELFDATAAALVASAPSVLVIEDAHWADTSTRELVTFLLARLDAARVALIISYRSDDLNRKHPLRQSLSEWNRLPFVRRIELASLDADASYRLLDNLPVSMEPGVREAIVERAGGNPFFIEELAAARNRSGSSIPPDLAELLLVRLDTVTPAAKAVVETMAVAGPRVAHDVLGTVTGLADSELDDIVREIVDARIVETAGSFYVFRHALLGEAIYDDVIPGRRSRLHAAFATALADHRHRGAAADLARHAELAHDIPLAFRAHVAAGGEATDLSAPAEAMAHYAAALELGQGDFEPSETALVLLYAEAATTAGEDLRALTAVTAELERGGEDFTVEDRIALLRAAASSAFLIEREHAALDSVEQALAIASAPLHSRWRVHLTGLAARITESLGRHDQSLSWARESVSIAEQTNDPATSADARITLARMEQRRNDPAASRVLLAESAELARRSGDTASELRSLFNLGMLEFDEGNLVEAQRALAAATDRAESTGRRWAPYGSGARSQLANALYYSGDWDAALDIVHAVGPAAPPLGSAVQLSAGFQIRAARGDYTVATDIERVRPYGTQDGWIILMSSAATAYTAVCAESFQDAITCMDDAVSAIGTQWHNVWFGARIRMSVLALEAARRGSDRIGAHEAMSIGARLHDDILRTAASTPASGWETNAWMLRGAAEFAYLNFRCGTGDIGSVVAAWHSVADAFTAHPFERARSLQALSEALMDAGDRTGGARAGESAAAIYDRLGVTVRPGSTAMTRARRQESLTPREHDVLALLGEGRTNKQIAENLVISVKTVSVHVSNVLTKLGAANRTEAAQFAVNRYRLDR
nr:LuxR C-terminal-related transcriptional regulator [Rhodococcus sp. (in: high G+C Gram-positive bacteria)]